LHEPNCFTARVVSRPRGVVCIEGKIVLERILNRRDSQYSPVAQDGLSRAFRAIIEFRILQKAGNFEQVFGRYVLKRDAAFRY
jgi:hypothetical protein